MVVNNNNNNSNNNIRERREASISHHYYYSFVRGGKYCDHCDCLSVCPLAYLKTTVHISPNFSAHVTVDVDNAIRYVLPVLWMTSCFCTMHGLGQNKDDAYVSSSSPDGVISRETDNVVWSRPPPGGTGVKSAFSDCILY